MIRNRNRVLLSTTFLIIVLFVISRLVTFNKQFEESKPSDNAHFAVRAKRITPTSKNEISCPPFRHHLLDPTRYQDAQQGLIYWRHIAKDNEKISPYRCDTMKPNTMDRKFLTFEPDEGGWNNMRMAMETAASMALIMGRVLVLPPRYRVLRWSKPFPPRWKRFFGFEDFLSLELAQKEMAGLEVISFRKFLEMFVQTGTVLADVQTGKPIQPPIRRTNWDGIIPSQSSKNGQGRLLWKWWRGVATPLLWDYSKCVAVFPNPSGPCVPSGWRYTTSTDEIRIREYLLKILQRNVARAQQKHSTNEILKMPYGYDALGNASGLERMEEMLADRRKLCVYDEQLQTVQVLHLMGEQVVSRFLVPFYAFLYVELDKHDLWIKRFVRDHLRYVDEIQCAAARIIASLRQVAYHPLHNPTGSFDSMHIRRGDFQRAYSDIITSPDFVYTHNTNAMLHDDRVVYVATDEKQKKWFQPLQAHYRLFFLNDFLYLLKGVDPSRHGMIDQVVAAAGDVFVGTYYSTFSAYINRIRGYRSQYRKDYGWKEGVVKSYYYSSSPNYDYVREIMQSYRKVQPPFWAQEFPVAWRDLDRDVFYNRN